MHQCTVPYYFLFSKLFQSHKENCKRSLSDSSWTRENMPDLNSRLLCRTSNFCENCAN